MCDVRCEKGRHVPHERPTHDGKSARRGGRLRCNRRIFFWNETSSGGNLI